MTITAKYKSQTDEELMIGVQEKDARSFSELYDRYSGRLLNYFFKMLWNDREKAEDFMQELFTKVINKPELYKSSFKVKTWLFSIANNMCKNEYRSEEVRRKAKNHFEYHGERHEKSDGAKKMDKKLFYDELDEVLSDLDEVKRSTFIMRFKHNLSVKEISETMNCSEGTVKSRLFYTLKHLNKQLKHFEGVLIWIAIILNF